MDRLRLSFQSLSVGNTIAKTSRRRCVKSLVLTDDPAITARFIEFPASNYQGSASRNIEILEKQNQLFSLEPVIKCLLLHLLTTVGPPLSDHSKCEVLMAITGRCCLRIFFLEGIYCMQFLRYDMSSFMFSQKVFRMLVYSAERDHTIRHLIAYYMCTVNSRLADTSL